VTHVKDVVNDALRIASVLNKHMNESTCEHTLKEVATEIFEQMEGPRVHQTPEPSAQPATIQSVIQNDDQD
jgi:hypothetical protein